MLSAGDGCFLKAKLDLSEDNQMKGKEQGREREGEEPSRKAGQVQSRVMSMGEGPERAPKGLQARETQVTTRLRL